MDCAKIKEHLYQFIDKELDDETITLVEDHLAECPLCQMEVDKEKQLDCLIRSHFVKEDAPYKLKEKILASLKKKRTDNVFFRSIPVLALVSCIIIVLVAVVVGGRSRQTALFQNAVHEHIESVKNTSSMEATSTDTTYISQWIQATLGFNVNTPDLSSRGAAVKGVRSESINGVDSAVIAYEKEGHLISMFVFEASGTKLPGVRRVEINEKTFYLGRHKGFQIVYWIDGEIGCMFVSDIDEADLLHLATL